MQRIDAGEFDDLAGKFFDFEDAAEHERALLVLGLVGLGGALKLESVEVCVAVLAVDVEGEVFEVFGDNDPDDHLVDTGRVSIGIERHDLQHHLLLLLRDVRLGLQDARARR